MYLLSHTEDLGDSCEPSQHGADRKHNILMYSLGFRDDQDQGPLSLSTDDDKCAMVGMAEKRGEDVRMGGRAP